MSQADQQEEAIFESALRLSGPEKAAYLDSACAGDPELRRRVERLLGAFERATSFLQEAAVVGPGQSLGVTARLTDKPGDKVGRFKLLQQIVEGGMGVVYMAEQEEPVRRRVALKIVKLGMDTKQVVARFEAERQALA